jgi:hypothetical protein
MAGKFRNMGLNETGIYEGLKDFATTKCENPNYDDAKIRVLAHAASATFDPVIDPEESELSSAYYKILAANREMRTWNEAAIASRGEAR